MIMSVMRLPSWLSGERICLPMQETQEMWVRSLGQEDPLEEEMATHSSILAWKIPRMEEPGRLQSMGSLRVRNDWVTKQQLLYNIVSVSAMQQLKSTVTICMYVYTYIHTYVCAPCLPHLLCFLGGSPVPLPRWALDSTAKSSRSLIY